MYSASERALLHWNSTPLSSLRHTFQEPDIQIDNATFESWKQEQLANTDSLLTTAITKSQDPTHQVLASRALVRARLQQWDAALVDAEMVIVSLLHTLTLMPIYTKAIKYQPSVVAYIAKSIAHIGMGERDKGYQACDIAFERFHSAHGNFIRLIKVSICNLRSPQPLMSLRLSLCLWPESTAMRYRA